MTFGKWDSSARDFLAGDLDHYQGLVASDLKRLQQVVGWAKKYNIKVVLTPLQLPGNRWPQNNGGKKDLRLWQSKKWWVSSEQYWQDIAGAFKDDDTVVAYNIINEPSPEYGTGLSEQASEAEYKAWYQKYKGTSRDLPDFYNRVIAAIRTVDKETTIMVDSGWYANPRAFSYWPKLDDDNVLYSFHMYEPFSFTNRKNYIRSKKNKPMFSYPGKIPFNGELQYWDKKALMGYMAPYFNWAKRHDISSKQLVAAEFGAHRMVPGVDTYLNDLLEIFKAQKIHWAFYAYREDEWDGYDYEMGTRKLSWDYWKAIDKGMLPDRSWQQDGKAWKVIEKALMALD